MALTSNQLNPLEFAKEIYAWVKGETSIPPSGDKWDIKSNEVKYSYDLTGCAGSNKTVVAEETKE